MKKFILICSILVGAGLALMSQQVGPGGGGTLGGGNYILTGWGGGLTNIWATNIAGWNSLSQVIPNYALAPSGNNTLLGYGGSGLPIDVTVNASSGVTLISGTLSLSAVPITSLATTGGPGVLTNNGAGTLSWVAVGGGSGSGTVTTLSPDAAGVIASVAGDGTTTVTPTFATPIQTLAAVIPANTVIGNPTASSALGTASGNLHVTNVDAFNVTASNSVTFGSGMVLSQSGTTPTFATSILNPNNLSLVTLDGVTAGDELGTLGCAEVNASGGCLFGNVVSLANITVNAYTSKFVGNGAGITNLPGFPIFANSLGTLATANQLYAVGQGIISAAVGANTNFAIIAPRPYNLTSFYGSYGGTLWGPGTNCTNIVYVNGVATTLSFVYGGPTQTRSTHDTTHTYTGNAGDEILFTVEANVVLPSSSFAVSVLMQ